MFATLRTTEESLGIISRSTEPPGNGPGIEACVECRQKKLKCTGQRSGCQRCVENGKKCAYVGNRYNKGDLAAGTRAQRNLQDSTAARASPSDWQRPRAHRVPSKPALSPNNPSTPLSGPRGPQETSSCQDMPQHEWPQQTLSGTIAPSIDTTMPGFDSPTSPGTFDPDTSSQDMQVLQSASHDFSSNPALGLGDCSDFNLCELLESDMLSNLPMDMEQQSNGMLDTGASSAATPSLGFSRHSSPQRSASSTAGPAPSTGCRRSSPANNVTKRRAVCAASPRAPSGPGLNATAARATRHSCWIQALRTLELACPSADTLTPQEFLRFLRDLKRTVTCFKELSQCEQCLRFPLFLVLVSTCLERAADTAVSAARGSRSDHTSFEFAGGTDHYGVDTVEEFCSMYSTILVRYTGDLMEIIHELQKGRSGNLLQAYDQCLQRTLSKLSALEVDLLGLL